MGIEGFAKYDPDEIETIIAVMHFQFMIPREVPDNKETLEKHKVSFGELIERFKHIYLSRKEGLNKTQGYDKHMLNGIMNRVLEPIMQYHNNVLKKLEQMV